MAKFRITSKGEVTRKKDLLERLGVAYGDENEVEVIGTGKGSIRAVEKKLPIESIIGILPNRTGQSQSIETSTRR